MREKVKEHFFWHKYLGSDTDPKKIFQEYYGREGQKKWKYGTQRDSFIFFLLISTTLFRHNIIQKIEN